MPSTACPFRSTRNMLANRHMRMVRMFVPHEDHTKPQKRERIFPPSLPP